MFYTQDRLQLGYLDFDTQWIPNGMYCQVVEGETDSMGYGKDYQSVITEATKKMQEKHGTNWVVINTKVKIVSASAHPSYHRKALLITGDMYKRVT